MQILAGLILLAILILVHEFGHFIVAKLLGVRVLTFSIGFGPKLFSFKIGDTEYCISAIPLGGYIKMYGDQFTDKIPLSKHKISFLHQSTWKKSAIAMAGPLFNFILPIILFFFIFIGTEKINEPIIGTIIENNPASIIGLKSGDKIISVNEKPIKTFSEITEIISKNSNKKLNITIKRKEDDAVTIIKKIIIPKYKFYIDKFNNKKKIGYIGVLSSIKKTIITVPLSNNPASDYNFKTFDEISEVNGNKIINNQIFSNYTDNDYKKLTIKFTRKNEKIIKKLYLKSELKNFKLLQIEKIKYFGISKNEFNNIKFQKIINQTKISLKNAQKKIFTNYGFSFSDGTISKIIKSKIPKRLGIKIGDQIISINGKPINNSIQINNILNFSNHKKIYTLGVLGNNKSSIYIFKIKKINNIKSNNQINLMKIFGLKLNINYKLAKIKKIKQNYIKSIINSIKKTNELIILTAKSLLMLLSGNISVSQLSGPISIFNVAGKAATEGLSVYMFVMALISINLGLINLLPVPILDGGHLLIFAIEAIQRKQLSIKTKQIASKIGFIILITLTVLAIFNDITRLLN